MVSPLKVPYAQLPPFSDASVGAVNVTGSALHVPGFVSAYVVLRRTLSVREEN